MVGGTVIENVVADLESGTPARRLWCVERRNPSNECAVFADIDEASDVQPGDLIWWQGGKIFWTRYENPEDEEPIFCEREISKIGFSFDPRGKGDK